MSLYGKKGLHFKWSDNNEKLKKLDTVSFNLPAFRSQDGFAVCPMAGACATVCYARQGRYVIAPVRATREFNLALVRSLKGAKIADLLAEDISKFRQTVIRVHDSGDFFDQNYLSAWLTVASMFPDKRFYAYTKSLHLDWTATPSNFQKVQSVGGLMDKSINPKESHSRIFASHKDRLVAGYVNGNINDAPAIRGDNKIGLVYHGTKHLKDGQVRWLSLRPVLGPSQ